jgi:hypothetical protein
MNYGRNCRSRRSSEKLVLKHARRPRAKLLELLSSSAPRFAATAVLSDRPISHCAQGEAVMAAADRRTRALRIGDRPRAMAKQVIYEGFKPPSQTVCLKIELEFSWTSSSAPRSFAMLQRSVI